MFKRILVPYDGSDASGRALAAAIELARSPGGRIRVVHQLEDRSYLAAYDPSGASAGELFKVMRAAGVQVLAQGTAAARAAGVEADELLLDSLGSPLGEAVADAATAWEADLIAVGTHGRRGVPRALLGSGAEQIVRLAPVPVLVLRDTAAARHQPASNQPGHFSKDQS